jgi:integrase
LQQLKVFIGKPCSIVHSCALECSLRVPRQFRGRHHGKQDRHPHKARKAQGSQRTLLRVLRHPAVRRVSQSPDTRALRLVRQGLHRQKVLTGEADFEQARQGARDFAELVRNGAVARKTDTVLAACEAYVAHVRDIDRAPARADALASAIRRAVEGTPLAGADLATLDQPMFTAWRVALSEGTVGKGRFSRPLASSTINREMVPLRAALRWAVDHKLIKDDGAFRLPLRPIKDANGTRDTYLTKTERQALLAALEAAEPTLHKLAYLCTLLPLRPGAAAALTVADLQHGKLTIRKDKTLAGNKTRTIALPGAALAFLSEQAKDKLPAAPLLPNADGGHWESKRWFKPMRAAVKAAGLPADVVLYTLRHSLLTDMANGGLPLAVVAEMAGTSVGMIGATYYQGANEAMLAEMDRIVGL